MGEPGCRLTVDGQSRGLYRTVSEAIEAAPDEAETLIDIAPGVYKEKIFCEKKKIWLRGAGRAETVLRWHDGAYQRHRDGRKTGTFRSYTLFLGGEQARVSRLTVENAAGEGETAGQGLAVYADADCVWMEDVLLKGCQDTLFCAPLPLRERQPGGFLGPRERSPRRATRQYYDRCTVVGDIDFIFGGADAVFDACQIVSRDLRRAVNGYVTAPSGPPDGLGFVFRRCAFSSASAPGTVFLGRPWRAYGKTTLLRCRLGGHIAPEGWDDWGDAENQCTACFSEYASTGEGGAQASQRVSWAHPLRSAEADIWSRRAEQVKEAVCRGWSKA